MKTFNTKTQGEVQIDGPAVIIKVIEGKNSYIHKALPDTPENFRTMQKELSTLGLGVMRTLEIVR